MALRGLILGFCLVNIAQILAIEQSSDTYDQIYSRAREAYSNQDWSECVKQINNALKDYKFYRSTLITCRRECRANVMNENETTVSPELENMIPFFFKIIKVSNCVRTCKQTNMPDRPDVAVHIDIEDDFEMRMPYDYLQFCLYKATKINYYTTPTLQPYCPTHLMKETCTYKRDNVKQAVAAAYTYLMADAKQETTVQNLMYYQQFPEVDTSDFIDLERRPYQAAFIKGQENQRNGEWQEGIKYIEEAITEFIKEEEECRILCEGPYDHESFPEFINAVSEHYISVLKCQNKCEEKLSILHGEKKKDFFPEMYNYLQYGYYKLNDIPHAVKATASYLLFKPEDTTMLENKRIYIKSGITPENIIPRTEAMKYFTHKKQIKNVLQYVTEKYVFAIDDEGEIDDSLKMIDLDSVDPVNHKQLNENHYLHIFEKYGLKIMAEPNDLFEPYRLVVDGFIGEEQCQEMINLVSLQKTVDDMKTLTVPETVEKMNVSEDYNVGLRLLLRMSGIAKQFIQKYLNHNIFHYSTKVICKAKWNGHCFLTESGKCLSEFVPEGSFQSITHLSSIPKAGGSYFAKPEEIIIRPRCGRMILFRSTDPLGVKPFNESEMERCVLWNVFGNDPMQDEIDHLDALILLRNMDQQLMLNTSESRNKVLNDLLNQGVEVVSTEKEMLGKERFIADGLASQAECETLIDLANAGGSLGDGYDRAASPHSANEYFVGLSIPGAIEDGSVRGDGYKHQQGILSLISPHTKHELFQGLTVARAAKLVKEGSVSFDAVSLFLKLAEKGRLLVEKYLNLTKPLYFDFTHLVCRTAVDEDELDRSDLSHPIHADNCLLQPDGTCLKEVPAYIQRDYSAIIYLNGEFTGGEFIFAYPNKSEQLSMKPKCGRLVGFNAADYHGVKAVVKGQRCCLAMWYTQDPDFKELAHNQAYKILRQVEKERQESEKSDTDNGVNDIVKDQPNSSSSDSSTDISSKEENTDNISNKNEEL